MGCNVNWLNIDLCFLMLIQSFIAVVRKYTRDSSWDLLGCDAI